MPSGDAAIEIQDSGPGIAAVHHDRIFERFYRVDQGRSREAGGAGLGLATARWAVEVNGGRLELESEEGKGSLFRIVLPRGGERLTRMSGSLQWRTRDQAS
jgi:signal transduction histidine kinase